MRKITLATVALLITVAAVPVATAQAGPDTTTPEANGTETTSTPGPVDRAETAVETAVPTAPSGSDGESGTQTPGSEAREQVQPGLLLLNSTYDGDAAPGSNRGVVRLTLRAESPVAVTLVDAGAFQLGGELPSRTLRPWSGESTFEFTVYKPSGAEFVGVTIVTEETMYAEPIRVSQDSEDPAPAERHYLALLVGVAGTTVSGVVIGKIRGRRREEGVTRVEG